MCTSTEQIKTFGGSATRRNSPAVALRNLGEKSREPPRSVLRKKQACQTVIRQRLHKSESMEKSREWYAKEVDAQLKRGGLFRDPFMPLKNFTGCKDDKASQERGYEWIRPPDLVSNPQFVVGDFSRFAVNQGELGDCSFLAAVSSLSMESSLLSQVVPEGQSFASDKPLSKNFLPYCGMFWFRFWQFGDWYDVVVDDRLPTRNKRLVFMHSVHNNEFWSALLEKAYAKLLGSYELISGGNASEAMEDFTGGLTELMELGYKTPDNLFNIMLNASSHGSLMACFICPSKDVSKQEDELNGLIVGHAYSVIDIRRFQTQSENKSVQLIRLRNPWGNNREWKGNWNDNSNLWKTIAPSEKKNIRLSFRDNGEFWISFEDFTRNFSRLEFCHLGPDSVVSNTNSYFERQPQKWKMIREEGEWLKYSTAGGALISGDTFHRNPQFRIQVPQPEGSAGRTYGTIIVGLMQKGIRDMHQKPRSIGYTIHRLPPEYVQKGPLGKSFFSAYAAMAASPGYLNTREVCGRHKLRPGEYVITPSTFNQNEEAKFLLRIFSERVCESVELDTTTCVFDPVDFNPNPPGGPQSLTMEFKEAFRNVAGQSGVIGAAKLRDILNAAFVQEFPFDGFSIETARSMVALMDADLTGVLGFSQFENLWKNLKQWKTIFKRYDRNCTGKMNAFDLREVMKTVGVRMSNQVYKVITCRYTDGDGQIEFNDYIMLVVRMTTLFETFKAQTHLKDGRAVVEMDEFIRSGLYT
ncbi:unnamed protein product [Calicophoron daubneyi]|uniref:Uncharacterized protein n=1 Tax=Calicophoron daubneyi TaxID=300641 RepID=A0AAV2TWZ0_CALDB